MWFSLCLDILLLLFRNVSLLPVPVAARSKALVYGRLPAAIMGSNPTQGLDVCVLSVVCCQVEVSATD